jgi:cation diffusion facilitator family transporter
MIPAPVVAARSTRSAAEDESIDGGAARARHCRSQVHDQLIVDPHNRSPGCYSWLIYLSSQLQGGTFPSKLSMVVVMNRAAKTAQLSILSNSILIIMKLIIGLISGSVSIISEAIHSTMDLVAAVIAFFSIRMAQRPADREHAYGHEKIENISGVIEAALIFIAAGLIIIQSVKKITTQSPVSQLGLGVAVMLIAGITNIFVSRHLYKVARIEESVALEADALHLKTDVYSSLGVAGGLFIIVLIERVFHVTWAHYLDPVVAIAIAVFILKEAWNMLKTAFGPLIDESLSAADLAKLETRMALYPNVSMHSVRSRRSGRTKYIDFHLSVPETMTVKQSHELCDEIERELGKDLSNTNVLIHIEPILTVSSGSGGHLTKDELLLRLVETGHKVAGYNIQPHHLHLFDSDGWTEITFHIDVDANTTVKKAHILANELEKQVKKQLGLEATVHIEPRQDSAGERKK